MKDELGSDHRFQGGCREGGERARSTRSGWEASCRSDGLSLVNLVTVVFEECCLFGAKRADIQGQLNAPLQQGLLDAGLGTQQVTSISEGYPATVEQLVDVRG